jgi:cell division protein FtsN
MILSKNFFSLVQSLGVLILVTLISACASDLQTKVSGHLNDLSKDQTVAILPVEASDTGQKEMAKMFRQGLYANLKQSKFNLLEKYIVDGLLKQNHLNDPASFLNINPMQFGEILGADAIVFSRINKVERSYFILHSSIELSVSVQMIDTRTGEILWRAEQTEHDFSGIGKIPTGITTALFAPIQFVTNKFNLSKMTSKMVDKLTALVKKPENAKKETHFKDTLIAKNATNDLKKIEELQQLKSQWNQAVDLDETIEVSTKQKIQSKTLLHKKDSSHANLIGRIQNEVPLKATVRKEVAVDTEMARNPMGPKIKIRKIITPIPLSTYKTTLAIPNESQAQQSREKVKSGESKNKNFKKVLYTVQVGAYKTKSYAESLFKKLIKKGYKAYVIHNGTYKVQVDRFEKKEEAEKFAQDIEVKEKLKYFVTMAW